MGLTCSAPYPTTTTGFSVEACFKASSTCQSMGLPHKGCSTLGRSDFMRVPCPAASTIAATFMVDSYKQNRLYIREAEQSLLREKSPPARVGWSRLGRLDSNQDPQIQSLVCCPCTTPQSGQIVSQRVLKDTGRVNAAQATIHAWQSA